MSFSFNVDNVEQAFLRATFEPTRWNEAMDVAARECGAAGGVLLPLRARAAPAPASASLFELHRRYFAEGWHARDERERGLPVLARRGVLVDQDFIDVERMARDPFYQDLLAPFGLRWFAGVAVSTADESWVLTIQRTSAAGPYTPVEQARLAGWSRKLSSVATLTGQIGRKADQRVFGALGALGMPALLVDRFGRILEFNPAAEALQGADLAFAGGAIRIRHKEGAERVARALAKILNAEAPATSCGPVVAPREHGRPFLLFFVSLDRQDTNPFSPARAIVLIRDLDAVPRSEPRVLMSAFALTRAEAEFARLLAAGESLDEAAEKLEITRETARSRLKRIFTKTSTGRQGALAALLARALNFP